MIIEIEQGDALTLLLIIIPAGLAAVYWAYVYMKRRQSKIVFEAIRERDDAFTACIDANKRLTEEAGKITSNMLDLVVTILVYLISPKDTQEEVDALAALNLALEALTADVLKEARDRLTVDAKLLIEDIVGQSWDQMIEDSETKPSSKGHETIGGNGDYF